MTMPNAAEKKKTKDQEKLNDTPLSNVISLRALSEPINNKELRDNSFNDTAISQADDPNRPDAFPKMVSWPGMALVCWIFTALVGMVGLTGLGTGPTIYSGMGVDFAPIAHSEATLFILLGFSLVFYVYGVTRKYSKPMVLGVVLSEAVFSLLKLVEHFGNSWLGIESLFNLNPVLFRSFLVGTMSPLSAVLFISMSVSVFLMVIVSDQRRRAIKIAMWLTSASALGTVILILGYCFGTPFGYTGNVTPVSLPAAVAFLFLQAGILIAIGPDHYPVHVKLNRE